MSLGEVPTGEHSNGWDSNFLMFQRPIVIVFNEMGNLCCLFVFGITSLDCVFE